MESGLFKHRMGCVLCFKTIKPMQSGRPSGDFVGNFPLILLARLVASDVWGVAVVYFENRVISGCAGTRCPQGAGAVGSTESIQRVLLPAAIHDDQRL